MRRHPDDPERYLVVLGSRRVAAHRLLGREEIEVIVRRLEDDRAFLASCVENVQRVALSPREELDMVGVLTDALGSQGAAARALGKSPTWVSKRKRVLAAPALAAAVEGGEISLDHAYDIATRAANEAAMLTQLARARAGEQSQGATRDALAPRPRPAMVASTAAEPATMSEHIFDGHGATIPSRAARELPVGRGEGSTPRASAISGRNRATGRPSPLTDAGEEPVDLDALAIVRLAQDRPRRVPRRVALEALRADAALLEGG